MRELRLPVDAHSVRKADSGGVQSPSLYKALLLLCWALWAVKRDGPPHPKVSGTMPYLAPREVSTMEEGRLEGTGSGDDESSLRHTVKLRSRNT